MNISIIIVNYNSTKYIDRLVKSINKFLTNVVYEIIIVDNYSPNRDIKNFANENEKENVEFVFLDKNYGFGYANNRGMEKAKYELLLLLNPDTYLVNDSLIKMAEKFISKPSWGIIGPMVKYENGNIQESALKFPNIRYEFYSMFYFLSPIIRYSKLARRKLFGNREYETDFIFGSCMLIKKEVNNILNGFDEDYFLFAEETDYCFRTYKNTNFKVVHFPKAVINHTAGAITNKVPYRRIYQGYNSKLIFMLKNYSAIYSFMLRYSVIMLFYKKIFLLQIKKVPDCKEGINIYKKIISIYYTKSPELNEI